MQDFIRWKKEVVLARFKPDGWREIDKSFKDHDGYYVGVFVTSVSYAYNKDLVKPAEVPQSAQDFLRPQFKGKMITCYPHDDDITLYLFYTLVERYGWDFMTKYMANGAQFVQGHLGVSRSLASGESMVSIDSNPNFSLREQRAGKPVADFVLQDRCDAGLGADRRHLQGRAASERGAAVPELVPGEGAAKQARHLVAAPGCAAAGRAAAAVLAQARQQISGLHQQYRPRRLSAQALRGLHRAGAKEGRREIAGPVSLAIRSSSPQHVRTGDVRIVA